MGGAIKFIFRDIDGSVHVKWTWTNSLPFILNDVRTMQKDQAYIQKYLLDPPNIYDIPESKNTVVPGSEYGLVVLDWQKNKLYSCSGYSTFGVASKFHFMFENYSDPEEIEEGYNRLCKEGRIMSLLGFAGKIPTDATELPFVEVLDLRGKTIPQIQEIFESNSMKETPIDRAYYVKLDFSPLSVITFRDSMYGFRGMKKLMEDDGFVLADGWDEFTNPKEE